MVEEAQAILTELESLLVKVLGMEIVQKTKIVDGDTLLVTTQTARQAEKLEHFLQQLGLVSSKTPQMTMA